MNSVDHYDVGEGKPGPLTRRIQKLYFDIVSGAVPRYRHWLTPVYGSAASKTAAAAKPAATKKASAKKAAAPKVAAKKA